MAERVVRWKIRDVAASEATPTGRIEAFDSEGRELTVELPTAWIRGAQQGDTFILHFQIERNKSR